MDLIGGFNLDGQKLAVQNPARPGPGNGAPARRALPGGRPALESRTDARAGAARAVRGAGRGAADDRAAPAEVDG